MREKINWIKKHKRQKTSFVIIVDSVLIPFYHNSNPHSNTLPQKIFSSTIKGANK
ncbi:hypothetical protein M33023_03060 [Candidatus Phytoplasma asteris]|uniref:Uncharacterized protein n=2 Tax=16SrI (Aster yellows group) TaxID=3042590 RepID=Q2NJF1_AYWBP|nr:hypothetical protein AYWB_325 [Aster yellows witches'-broom phytoplasma AYWB]